MNAIINAVKWFYAFNGNWSFFQILLWAVGRGLLLIATIFFLSWFVPKLRYLIVGIASDMWNLIWLGILFHEFPHYDPQLFKRQAYAISLQLGRWAVEILNLNSEEAQIRQEIEKSVHGYKKMAKPLSRVIGTQKKMLFKFNMGTKVARYFGFNIVTGNPQYMAEWWRKQQEILSKKGITG